MRINPIFILSILSVALVACTTAPSDQKVADTTTSWDCDQVVDNQSELGRIFLDTSTGAKIRCGHGVVDKTGDEVDIADGYAMNLDTASYPGETIAPSLILLVVRAENPKAKLEPWDMTKPRKKFPIRSIGKTPVIFGRSPAIANLYRQNSPEFNVVYSCLSVDGRGPSGLPSGAEICRRVKNDSSDEDIIRVAKEYVAKDIESLRP